MAAINSASDADTDDLNRNRTRDVYRRRKERMLDKLQRNNSQQVSNAFCAAIVWLVFILPGLVGENCLTGRGSCVIVLDTSSHFYNYCH